MVLHDPPEGRDHRLGRDLHVIGWFHLRTTTTKGNLQRFRVRIVLLFRPASAWALRSIDGIDGTMPPSLDHSTQTKRNTRNEGIEDEKQENQRKKPTKRSNNEPKF